MSGFQRKRYRLTWGEGTGYDGLEVTCKPPSMDVMLRLDDLKAGAAEGKTEDIRDLLGLFADVITDWNVRDDDDQPVPVSAAELLSDIPMAMAIVMNYSDKVAAASMVPPPLPARSGSGPENPEIRLQIPMDPNPETAEGPRSLAS
jgi:hypothetical protein